MVTADKILKKEGVIRIRPYDTISTALIKLSTSHDAAFVFSETESFLGAINPYYCLIQSSYPGNAKVEHCLFHPPHIALNDSFERMAQLFIESKLHYLPVFNQENIFEGITTANRLLTACESMPVFKIKIEDFVKKRNKPLVNITESDSVSTAIHLYKQYKISKLVVINKDLKLSGIVSYYDLIYYLISPKEKLRQGEKEGNKISFYHHPVKNFAKTTVLTMNSSSTMTDALRLMLEKKIGSVVITDSERHPLYIITKKDMLQLITKKEMKKPLQVIKKNLSNQSHHMAEPFFDYVASFLTRLPLMAAARVMIKEEKNGGVFKIVLSLIPKNGPIRVITREGKNLREIIKEVGSKLMGLKKRNSN